MRFLNSFWALSLVLMIAPVLSAQSEPTEEVNKTADSQPLSTVMNAESTKQFTGSPISLNLKDADVHEVLRMIGEASGFNILIHPSVTGKLTLALDHVPWDQALDVVLTTLNLGADRSDSILRVLPRAMLIQEKQSELDAKKLVAAATPRVTRVFPVSYAEPTTLSALLQTITNAQNNAPGSSGVPTTIIVDANTQSLIVRDTLENIERIRKMIELLDVQTPQVMVEAKAIEASDSFATDLEGNLSVGGPGYTLGVNSQLTSATTSTAGTASSTSTTAGDRTNSVVLKIAQTLSLNALLNYSEKSSKVKVISSPRMVVLSGKSANIVQGSNLPVSTTSLTASGAQGGTTFIPYNTSLNVTPRVTNDGSVFMKLSLQRDTVETFNGTAVTSPRSMSTEVIVESGSTIVLGGVLSIDESESEQGIPFLRKIPVIGWLFGSETDSKKKTELMFFVTPRILNSKKAGVVDAVAQPSTTEGAPKL